MKSRIEDKARELFADGKALSKYDLSLTAHCDQRHAARVLKKLHQGGNVRICKWVRIYWAWIPVYKTGKQLDIPKPEPKSKAEQARERRKDINVRIREAMMKRAARLLRGAHSKRNGSVLFKDWCGRDPAQNQIDQAD